MGINIRTSSCLLLSLYCCFCCSAADHEKQQQFPSAMVVGTVYCDTCFHQEFSKSSHFISGASVEIECGDGATKPSFQKKVNTNRHGIFRVRLPPKVGKHLDKIKACSVKLIRSNEPFCAVASFATSTSLRLKSRRNGVHVFSAGFFTFKPLKQPELCYQEPKPLSSTKFSSLADRKQPQAGFSFFTPPIPFLPSPPNIGGIPLPPNIGGIPLPPNPLQPPTSVLPPIFPSPPNIGGIPLPPNPLQPPPSILSPLPFQPSPAIRFPPLPIPLNPLPPGNPPASPSTP